MGRLSNEDVHKVPNKNEADLEREDERIKEEGLNEPYLFEHGNIPRPTEEKIKEQAQQIYTDYEKGSESFFSDYNSLIHRLENLVNGKGHHNLDPRYMYPGYKKNDIRKLIEELKNL